MQFSSAYLGASVLSAEYESRNSEILFLRGITPTSLYWTRLITLAAVGIVLVFVAGSLLLLSNTFSARGFAIVLRGCLHFLITCSLCFFFGSFVRGYLNAVLTFLFGLLSDLPAFMGRNISETGAPAWTILFPPSWHVAAIGRGGGLEWHALTHVGLVLIYCLLSVWIGMLIYRKFGSRLLSG
jgi:hypothetical protein